MSSKNYAIVAMVFVTMILTTFNTAKANIGPLPAQDNIQEPTRSDRVVESADINATDGIADIMVFVDLDEDNVPNNGDFIWVAEVEGYCRHQESGYIYEWNTGPTGEDAYFPLVPGYWYCKPYSLHNVDDTGWSYYGQGQTKYIDVFGTTEFDLRFIERRYIFAPEINGE